MEKSRCIDLTTRCGITLNFGGVIDYHCKTARPRVEVVQECFRHALTGQYEKYSDVLEICERVAFQVLRRDIAPKIKLTLDKIMNPETPISKYELFQLLMIEEIRIVGEKSLTVRFIDGNEYPFTLGRNRNNRISELRE